MQTEYITIRGMRDTTMFEVLGVKSVEIDGRKLVVKLPESLGRTGNRRNFLFVWSPSTGTMLNLLRCNVNGKYVDTEPFTCCAIY